jgi:arylsulfatase A-like enzyme
MRRLGPVQIDAVATDYRLRSESLLAVDEAVVRIFRALEESGELDRTLVIFTSDNGFFHGEHRIRQGKVRLYEPSIRVPLLVRGPGVPKGVRLSQAVSNVDLAPTIVAAAGATPARRFDGRSLYPLFRGEWWGRDLLVEGPGASLATRQFTAIRTPRYLYAEHRTGEKELYDLGLDPHQLVNRAGAATHASMERELARRLARLRNCAGSVCLAGPTFTVRCAAGRASVTGPDARWVQSTRVAGKRATVVFTDGRVVTRDC